MAQNDIGIDLGTTTIIIAQEGKGVVLNQPSVVAMDTRKNSVLEAGDKALAMVGRTPNYISAIFPLKDGVISDHTMTRELICRFVKQVYSSHMVKPRVAVCVPAAITGIESDAVVEAVVAAGARQVYLIDEPIAAALGYGPKLHGVRNKAELDQLVESSLRGAALWDEVKDRLKKSALGLSGGQQQRLCIARALAVKPEVLLMDEPTSALDPGSTMKVEELMSELKKNYTVVIVTHNMQQAARISDRTAFFLLGELVEVGPTNQIFSAPQDKRTEDYISGRFG